MTKQDLERAEAYVASCREPEDDDINLHPMQEVVWAGKIARFRENKIVDKLLEVANGVGFGLNQIALGMANGEYSDEDMIQLAQLIGYSVSGYGDLSYVQRHATKALNPADHAVNALPPYEAVDRLAQVTDE